MTKRLDIEPLRPSEVVSVMREGHQYSQKDLMLKLNRGIDTIRKVLGTMVMVGTIKVSMVGNAKRYELPAEEVRDVPLVPGRYVPPPTELGIYDLATKQRLCEGARNPVTGVV